MLLTGKRLLLFAVLLETNPLTAQVTTGSLGGEIRSAGGEKLVGATVQLVHEPTGTASFTRTNGSGLFYFNNLTVGGPYTVTASFINHNDGKRSELFIALGEEQQVILTLTPIQQTLREVTVYAKRYDTDHQSRVIDRETMERLPAVGRNLHDYLQTLPQAKLVNGNEGAISFAGQNNRYNAFYIDGTVNNDLFGLAASGTNGGQAGISPVSIEAIEQLRVAVSPYDASLGNFTGAAINAVTRSGSNTPQTSLYHFFRNSATNDHHQASRSYGFRTQGAFVRNRLFYFMNMELERSFFSRSFTTDHYLGKTNDATNLSLLAANLLSNYGYDAGSFDHTDDLLFADRISMRLDWKASARHSFTGSIRYTAGQRTFSNTSDADNLYFSHSGYGLSTKNTAASFEWKSVLGKNISSILTITHTIVDDDRTPAGKPFPRVRIYDDAGSIVFGTDISSGINLLKQRNSTLVNKFYFSLGKHRLTAGVDIEYSRIYNAFIQYALGSYSYSSPGDFIANANPSGYQLGFSMIDSMQGDHIRAAADFTVARGSLFVNDDYRISSRLSIQAGLRFDRYVFPDQPFTNASFNDSVLPLLAIYYPLKNAMVGKRINIPLSISPRLFLRYTVPALQLNIKLGAGIFSGRMPFAWPGGVYQYNGAYTGGFVADKTQLGKIRLRPDAYRQWMPAELQAIGNKDPINLVSGALKMPALCRFTASVEKNIANDCRLLLEVAYSWDISGIAYTNINLLPPVQKTAGPGERSVYTDSNAARIPLATAVNPYGSVILLHNREAATGYAYAFTASMRKKWRSGWETVLHYHWGRSFVLNEGTSSVNLSQWRTMESVNGRNNLTVSESDFSPGHRVLVTATKRFINASKKMPLTLTFSYSGQSGSPFSYVYGGSSMVRDEGKTGGYELIYVPETGELEKTIFLPLTIHATVITPAQQKELLENYFKADPYLRKRRGRFAERNGSRTPFTHTLDVKLVQDFGLPGKKRRVLQLSCEISNLANLLNRGWGRKYLLPFDQSAIIDFAGYAPGGGLTPQYRINPVLLQGPLFPENQSLNAAYSSYWSCQLGIRLIF